MIKKTANKKINVLPSDPNAAIRSMINISRKLSAFADQEAHALAVNDMIRFAYTQQDKEKIAQEYTSSSEEFRKRIEDFRKADKSLLNELDKLQVELKQKSQNNNATIRQIRDRAISNTKSTLFTVQEMGQRVSLQQSNAANGTIQHGA